MTHRRSRSVVLAVLVLWLVSESRAEVVALRTCDTYRLDYDTGTGRLAVKTPEGAMILGDLSTRVDLKQGNKVVSFSTPPPAAGALPQKTPFRDTLGKGQRFDLPVWSDPGKTFCVRTAAKLYDGQPFFVVVSSVHATTEAGLKLVRLIPLETTAGLGLDSDPRHVWFVENGNGLMLDFYVRRLPASKSANSNGNILCYAPRQDRGLALGFLSHDVARTGFRTEVASGDPPKVSRLAAQCHYDPPKPIESGQSIDSEGGVFVELTRGQPLAAAERWADCVAKVSGCGPFARGRLVKWNPWCARYKQGIDEQSMCAEMDAAAKKLLPYGMETFHIDAGWEQGWGDWDAGKKFPRGMKFLADRMRTLGFKTSIWMAPFAAQGDSKLARDHASWFLAKGALGQMILDKNKMALDLTKPEVKAWLTNLFRRSAQDWGYGCFKLDFLYYAMACAPFGDATKTMQEAYRDTLGLIRATIGNQRMLYPVGIPIISNVGYADVIRLGLDNMPVWNKARGPHDQGILTSVRTLARRYYLNHRLWINHPDVIFTGDPDTAKRWKAERVLTLDEARAWISLVALTGGVVCIGDSIVSLEGPRLDMVRRIIPPCGQTAQPLDLFEHRFPELWNLKIRRDFETWNVVGVFNWGLNDCWGKPMPDAPRQIRVRFADLGLEANGRYVVHEFWRDACLGVKSEGFEVTLRPHSCQVFAVRQARQTPQIVSTNRHISQGGVDIQSVRWDPEQWVLSCVQKLVGGWTYGIVVRAPKGFAPAETVRIKTATPNTEIKQRLRYVQDDLWRLELTSPKTCGSATWRMGFRSG